MLGSRPICQTTGTWPIVIGLLLIAADAKMTRVYRGSISETATQGDEVLLNIPLSVANRDGIDGDEVCGYTIFKWNAEMPFKAVLLDRQSGDAKIVLNDGFQLDYETKHKYTFDIAAYDCASGKHATRERVHVYVDDANEFDPVWTNKTYFATVEEGVGRKEIINVKATDADGSPGLSKICQYHVMNQDVPFDIDEDGMLRNTESLNANKVSRYELEVKAEDCGGRVSDDALISVQIIPVCKRGLTGVGDSSVIGTISQSLMPGSTLAVCDDTCQTERVSVTVRLQTSHIGRGCDRDELSLRQRRHDCGASLDYIDLLPDPANEGSWTSDLPTVDIADDTVFTFDGQTTAAQIPIGDLEPRNLGTSFSVSTWMKHDRETQDIKEHILCAADGEGMNRHHYALFVHNCRLVLLLRREPDAASMDALSPSEWRWKLPEVCDGNWHHYVINVEATQVRLYVDGRIFLTEDNAFEVLDDWPLHRSRLAQSTKVLVGACWQGAKGRLGHFFKGYLYGLIVAKNANDTDESIECLNECQEKLELSAMDTMETGMSVSINSAQNVLTVNGPSTESVQKLLRRLDYVNTRLFPTPAVRPVAVETHVKCADGRQPTYDVINVSVRVGQVDTLVLNLNGTTIIGWDDHHVTVGDRIFRDLVITTRQRRQSQPRDSDDSDIIGDTIAEITEGDDVSDRLKIGLCHVHVEPALNLEHEHLTLNSELVAKLQLELTSSEIGLTLSGVGGVVDYQQMLRSVGYTNNKPHDVNRRQFVVGCTEAGDHVTSNQLRVTLELIRQQHSQPAAHIVKESKPVMAESLRLVGKSFPASLKYDSQQTGIGVAVVMIVCVGFIIVLVVLGVMRVRNVRRCGPNDSSDDKQDLDWDNSALTITVNPMHPDNTDNDDQDGTGGTDDEDSDDCDSEDEGVVYRDVTRMNGSNRKLECARDWSGARSCASGSEQTRQTGSTTLVL